MQKAGKGYIQSVLLYNLVTLGTTILGGKQVKLHTIFYMKHSLRYNLLSAREVKLSYTEVHHSLYPVFGYHFTCKFLSAFK